MVSWALRRPQIVSSILAFWLIFTTSSTLCFNVFTTTIEDHEPSLISIWSRALGLGSVAFSVFMVVTAVIIDVQPSGNDVVHPLTRRVRIVTLPISGAHIFLILANIGVRQASPALLYIAVLSQALPCAFFYLVGIQVLTTWMPTRPELVMTLLTVSINVSQIIAAPIFSLSLSTFGFESTIKCITAILFSSALFCSLFLRFPSHTESRNLCESRSSFESVQSPNEECSPVTLSWPEILRTNSFYRYLPLFFLGRAPFALYHYFFKIGFVFGLQKNIVVIAFQLFNVAIIGSVLVCKTIIQLLPRRRGYIIRALLLFLYTAEILLFLLLVPISNRNLGSIAIVIISGLIVMHESQNVLAIILAQDVFGFQNGVIVFGLAGGIAMGCGDAFFTILITIMEGKYTGNESTPATYIPFYFQATIALSCASLLVLVQRKCTAAYLPLTSLPD